MRLNVLLVLILLSPVLSFGQMRWQQKVKYDIDIDLNVKKNTFSGTESLLYSNNSPDDLEQVFFHLYFNAFQPGSMMDVRSRTILDPDPRVGDRISKLNKKEVGRLTIAELSFDGQPCSFEQKGTILQVQLPRTLKAGESAMFQVEFEGQVPIQIRRSGRDNAEGIRFSMAQWYPKICEYDHMGWHANPYVGREFHGVWGDFDVKITLDPTYIIAATGTLQNKDEIGYGYTNREVDHSGKKSLTWHFRAENVHDFVWAADPDYKHLIYQVDGGPEFHFFYQEGEETEDWTKLPEYTAKAFEIMARRVGRYPYPQYSVVQGGDGGMEYPMVTLITGHRSLGSLVGVTVHESIHSWFQGMLATNESLYPWMDEGFTSYYTHETVAELLENEEPHAGSYMGYRTLVEAGLDEPMTIHADHYVTNYAYGINAYSKGTMFLNQLSYVVGQDAFEKGMQDYFETFKFHHPDPVDFRRSMEKASGIELDWYFEYMINTRHNVDYSVEEVSKKGGNTVVKLVRKGKMPMPIEVVVTDQTGAKAVYQIPLRMMWGSKQPENDLPTQVMADWPWTNTEYELEIPMKKKDIKTIEIDPSHRMADLQPMDNGWPKE